MRTPLLLTLSLSLLVTAVGCPPAPPKEIPAPSNGGSASGDSGDSGAPQSGGETSSETPPQPIRMGLTPAEGGSELQESARQLEAYLEKETGLDFQVDVPQDYGALIESMRYDQVQFGALAPLSFVKAENEAGARVLLKSVRKTGPWYYSAIITLKKYGYTSIEDLRGKKMAFGEPLSTAGTIFPKAGLIKAGIDPSTFFAEANNVGNHEVVVNAVLNGDYDAGATFCNSPEGDGGGWAQFLPEKADEFQILWVSEKIPADTISVKDTFQEKYPVTTQKVQEALLRLNDTPEGKKMLTDLYRIDGLVEAESSDYDIVREAAKLVDLPIK